MADADIVCNHDTGILTVRVNLKCENPKILCYGALKVAEEEASRYFIIQEMKKRQMQEKIGLIQPNGRPTA